MAKSSFERSIERQQRRTAHDQEKQKQDQKREANRQRREENKRHNTEMCVQRAKSIVEGQPSVGNIKILDKTAEEIVMAICNVYNDDMNMRITSQNITLPDYLQRDLTLEFEKLKQYGLISYYTVLTALDWEINIYPCFLTYECDKLDAIENDKKTDPLISVGDIYAENGSVVLGDLINSNVNIDNSINEIQRKIDESDDEDKEELSELLNELKELIESIEKTRSLPTNTGFLKRLTEHLDKHGWFYAEVIGLMGNFVLKLIG